MEYQGKELEIFDKANISEIYFLKLKNILKMIYLSRCQSRGFQGIY